MLAVLLDSASVDPVTTTVLIGRARSEVFDYLADIANHPEFTDHYMVDWRLTRIDSVGSGAGGRFRITAPGRFNWADLTLVEVDSPHLIVAAGRGGKYNRTRLLISFTLTEQSSSMTRVEMVTEIESAMPSDRIARSLGGHGWHKRKGAKAMRRLRSILEEGEARGERATVSA